SLPCQGRCEHVSIHAPAGGATEASDDMEVDALFQSTHPQGVRQRTKNPAFYLIVSIEFREPLEKRNLPDHRTKE
ncbi:MAG TPA: hypothetical protein PLH34_04120, partial [Bacillota bacterium]|nr:hypothetical protein [Bacillota bacterium]